MQNVWIANRTILIAIDCRKNILNAVENSATDVFLHKFRKNSDRTNLINRTAAEVIFFSRQLATTDN